MTITYHDLQPPSKRGSTVGHRQNICHRICSPVAAYTAAAITHHRPCELDLANDRDESEWRRGYWRRVELV
eukprot:scaffold76118_cov105-Cyclotella_meneghiniana.AAC.1